MDPKSILTAIRNVFSEPVLVRTDPDGDGELHYIRDGDGGYSQTAHEGPRRHQRLHTFATPGALAAFVNTERYDERPEIDVLVGDHKIAVAPWPHVCEGDLLTCYYRPHPEFEVWKDLLGGEPVSQRDLIQKVRAGAEALGEEQSADWLTALGILKVASKGSMESEVDRLGFTRLRGGEQSREVSTRIPPTLTVRTPLFEGIHNAAGEEIRYELELLVEFDTESLLFRLTCPLLPIVRARAVDDVAAMLERDLEDGFLVVRGELQFARVPATHLVARGELPDSPRAEE